MKILKRSLLLAFTLIMCITIFAGCGEVSAKAYTLTTAMQAKNGTGATKGSYDFTSAEWTTIKDKAGKAKFVYKFGDLATDAKYSRAVKVSTDVQDAKTHLFAVDTVGTESYYWDILNNLSAIKTESDGSAVPGGQALYDLLEDNYTGYWGAKLGNTYTSASSKEGTFYFVASKAGTYKVTIDIVSYTTGAVKGSTEVTFKVAE